MPIAGSTYWNISHGLVAEDAKQDEEGMQTMRNLARNMVWMMRSFAVAKEQGVPYPDTDKEKKYLRTLYVNTLALGEVL